jgi:hypothetical protein
LAGALTRKTRIAGERTGQQFLIKGGLTDENTRDRRCPIETSEQVIRGGDKRCPDWTLHLPEGALSGEIRCH